MDIFFKNIVYLKFLAILLELALDEFVVKWILFSFLLLLAVRKDMLRMNI